MTDISRRRLLQGAGALGLGAALAACDTAPNSDSSGGGSGSDSGGSKGPIAWWDHTPNLQAANARVFKEYEKDTGVPVEYQYHQTAKMGEALQLAKQSDQLPDVFTNVQLKLPIPGLIKEGWFQAVDFSDEALDRLPDGVLLEGIHTFDGEVFSVPIFYDKQYWAATWFNKDMVAEAGVEPPETYEDFRAAAKAVQKSTGDNTFGWIGNLGHVERVREQVNFLAQAAGFEGWGGDLFKTGEVMYHHDAYLTVIEFLLSLQKDGLMVPGSQTLDDKTARVKWAAGAAGYYFDGPWCPGSVSQDAGEFFDKIDVAPMLVPEAGMDVTAYRPPAGGMYYLSGTSKNVEITSQLLNHQTDEQYYIDIAKGHAQPPADLSVVDKAADELHPAWVKLVGWYQEDAFVAPVPGVRNPDVSKVQRLDKPIEPHLGQIVSGAFSGDVTDVKKALKDFSDKTMKQREDNVSAAKKEGAKVELDDWAFSNWQPRTDYTAEMYDA